MVILEDTRNQIGKHKIKNKYFADNGIKVERSKLYVGDYTLANKQNVCIDTKKDISELYGDMYGQHERFRNEMIAAKDAGIKLYILVENTNNIKYINQITRWKNPQFFKYWAEEKKAKKAGIPFKKKPPLS